MKKWLVLLAALVLLPLSACSRDMNWVISNEPSVRGVVEEIGEEYVLIRVLQTDDQDLAAASLVRAEKATRLQDCKFNCMVGQEVVVYYAGPVDVLPGEIPEIHGVHGYCS